VLQLNGSWLHVSAALRPSSCQLAQIKCPQCTYNMGSHIVRTLRALNLYKLAWRWPQCGRTCTQEPLSCST